MSAERLAGQTTRNEKCQLGCMDWFYLVGVRLFAGGSVLISCLTWPTLRRHDAPGANVVGQGHYSALDDSAMSDPFDTVPAASRMNCIALR